MGYEKKAKEWRTYKPKKTNDGAASKLELKVVTGVKESGDKKYATRETQTFWVSAKQTGMDANDNASFGWQDETKRVTLKLGENDIGEILCVLNGLKPVSGAVGGKFEGLFHKNDTGSACFILKRLDTGYGLRVSKKIGANDPIIISHMITFGEGEILRVLLESIIQQSYQWQD